MGTNNEPREKSLDDYFMKSAFVNFNKTIPNIILNINFKELEEMKRHVLWNLENK